MQRRKSKATASLAALCASSVALLLTLSSPAQAAACPNEAIRAEQGPAALALPDCRAYELITPGSTPFVLADNQLGGGAGGGMAAPDGDALSYFSRYPAEDTTMSSETYLSRRTAAGWSVAGVDPQMTPQSSDAGECQPGVAFSEDLSNYVFIAGGNVADSREVRAGNCGPPQEELVPGEPRGYSNLYVHRGGGPFVLANPPGEAIPGNATFQAASTDLSRIVFSESAKLTPDSPAGYNLFEWADGVVRLVGVLPNGERVPAVVGAATGDWNGIGPGSIRGLAPVSHSVSADGERVFFEANGSLYLRENAGQPPAADANCGTNGEPGLACTLQVDVSEWTGPSGGGVFEFASRNGDKVFFISDHALTENSKAAAGKSDLYEYDVQAETLRDVSVSASGSARVLGISGGADDGSRLYFVAEGVLTGSQQNQHGEVAQPSKPNLYLEQEGRPLTYVATFGDSTSEIETTGWWRGSLGNAWSPSGRYLVFASFKSLTGFDNTAANPAKCQGEPTCAELYLFDAVTETMTCVSCDPRGSGPIANTRGFKRTEFERFAFGPALLPRIVSDSGQVFLETANSLSPRDINGVEDVYEYNAGNLNLISSGTSAGGSAFVDASSDYRDVFFITPETFVRADTDGGLPSIYDARVDGGFAEPPPPEPCRGEESCRPGALPLPSVAPPATPGFVGSGNVKPPPCKHGKVRRGGHCVKKKAQHKKKAHHHRHKGTGKGGKS